MKGIIWVLVFMAAALLALVPSVQAEEEVSLDKIVVTPSRITENSDGVARSMEVITAKDIERSQAQDLSEVLSKLASVTISDYGGIGATKTVKMRGSTAAQVLVMVDGRPLNSPRDGQTELSAIPLDNIERIEVMRGPASSLYGAGAMGGTIHIITKNPPKKGQRTQLTSGFGTFRTYSERLVHGLGADGFGYLVSAGYLSSQGHRDNSEFASKDFNAKFTCAPNEYNSIAIQAGFYKNRSGTPGSVINADADDKQRALKNFIDLSWKFAPDDKTGFSAKVYENYERLEFIENSAGSIFDIENDKAIHATSVRGLDLQAHRRFCDTYSALVGFNYVTNLNDSTSSAKHEYLVRAFYAENKLDFFDERLRFSLDARADDYSNFGTELNPSFSVLYSPFEGLRARGLISRSFRAPTFNDLFWPDQGWAKGNPNLKPEKGVTKEIGAEADLSKALTCGITYYRSTYDDLINWAEEGFVWQPMNVDSAVIDGVESRNTLRLADAWTVEIDYAFVRAKDEKTGKYLIYQPKHKVDAALRCNDLLGFSFALRGQFTDKRFHNAANNTKVKRFAVAGIDISRKIAAGIESFLSIDNLLNRKYQTVKDYPMPGFSLTCGVKMEF